MKVFKKNAFTLIELLVVISIIALLIGILLPALGAARRTARSMQSNTQIRGIQQGMFIYASSNKDFFPGMQERTLIAPDACVNDTDIRTYGSGGLTAGSHVGARYAICLENNLFTPEYLISPFESNPLVQEWEDDGTVYVIDDAFYSYPLPRIKWYGGDNGGEMSEGRAFEWRATANASAVVVSDRLYAEGIAINNTLTWRSLNDPSKIGQWSGGVSFNDNHTETLATEETDSALVYAGYSTGGPDNLFLANKPATQTNWGSQHQNQYNAQQIIRGFTNWNFASGG